MPGRRKIREREIDRQKNISTIGNQLHKSIGIQI
jgi:hypothetical protein